MENPDPKRSQWSTRSVNVRGLRSRAVHRVRGLTVRDLQTLRKELRDVGGDYRVCKNTLVRRATNELELELSQTLVGPTGLTSWAPRPTELRVTQYSWRRL